MRDMTFSLLVLTQQSVETCLWFVGAARPKKERGKNGSLIRIIA